VDESVCDYGCGKTAIFLLGKEKRPCCCPDFQHCPGFHQPNVAKIKRTNLEKYGVEVPIQSKEIRSRVEATNLERYGVVNPSMSGSISQKIAFTHRERSSEEVRQSNTKRGKTNLEKYGTEWPNQNTTVQGSKKFFKRRQFTLPSGRSLSLQGYEPEVLQDLLNQGVHETEFEFDRKKHPEIWYSNPVTGRLSRYFPDFFLPGRNWIVEAKSPWTFELEKIENLAKQDACKAMGYRFDFIIKDHYGA